MLFEQIRRDAENCFHRRALPEGCGSQTSVPLARKTKPRPVTKTPAMKTTSPLWLALCSSAGGTRILSLPNTVCSIGCSRNSLTLAARNRSATRKSATPNRPRRPGGACPPTGEKFLQRAVTSFARSREGQPPANGTSSFPTSGFGEKMLGNTIQTTLHLTWWTRSFLPT